MKSGKVETKRRAGLPPREKPKPVTPVFGEAEKCALCDIGCAEPVRAACAIREAAGKNGPPTRKRISRTTDHWLEKPAMGEKGPIEPPPVQETAAVKRQGLQAIGTYLDPELIDPSPYQVRREFPAEEIRALAASIAAEGLISPIAVRVKGERYEVLAGNRRLRAVRLLGLPDVRVEVQKRSDAEARAIVLAENLQRKDLNPIEQARAFQAILDAGDYRTQEDLGKALGISQGQVSNTLRLLELPDGLQKRVISAEITIGQARAILPYAANPRLAAAIDEGIGAALAAAKKGGMDALPPAEEFGELIGDAAGKIGRRIRDGHERQWDQKSRRNYRPYQPSPEEAEELEIVKVEVWPGDIKRFALKRKRYDALEAEYRKAQVAAEDGKARKPATKADKAKAAAPPPRKLSAAEQKRLEEAERKRDAARRVEQARLTARKVHAWRINRLREAVAAAMRDPAAKGLKIEETKITLWLLLAAGGWTLHGSAAYARARDREELFRSIFHAGGGARGSIWPAIAGLDGPAIVERIPELLAALVWSPKEGPRIPIPDDVVIGMAEVCRVDLAALWKTDQNGAAGKGYYELHTREQLVDLGKELGVYLDSGKDKATMLQLLGNPRKVLALPRELGGKKAGSRKAAKIAKK